MKKTITTLTLGALLAVSGPAFLFAQTITVPATTTKTTVTTKAKAKIVNPICLQGAIEKRETSLIADYNTLNTSLTTALSVRKEALKSAVELPTKAEIVTAKSTANKTFDASAKSARTVMKASRTSAWTVYKTDTKACGSTVVEQPSITESGL